MLGVASWPWKHGVALTAERLLSPPAADTPAEPFTQRSTTLFFTVNCAHCGSSLHLDPRIVSPERRNNGFSPGVTPTPLGNVITKRTVS